jgi:O-antigen/teichoic acid export membrane protein
MDNDADSQAEHRRKLGFLFRSAAALVSTTVVTSGLGFIYWVAAARLFPASAVGQAATAIAAMNLIAPFTVLGFGTALMAQLPAMRERRAQLVSTAALVCGVVGGVVALVCALVLPASFLGITAVGHQVGATALFSAGVAAQGVGLMLDSALLSVVGGGIQFWRNAIHAVVKLTLLVAFALTLSLMGSLSIYASWFVANVVSITAVGIWLLYSRRVAIRRILPTFSILRTLQFDAARHHGLNLSLQVPYFAMPIVANVTLGSERAGYLYAVWSVAGFVFVLPIALSTALFASGARDSSTILKEFGVTLHYSMLACLAANIVILPFGGLVLRMFGRAYESNGHLALIILCVGGFGVVIRDHHVAMARIRGTVGREAIVISMLSVLELVGAAVGALHGGLTGLTVGWVAAIAVEAVVLGPMVWRAYRGRLEVPTQ